MSIHDPDQRVQKGEGRHAAPPLHQLAAELTATQMQLQTMRKTHANTVEALQRAKEYAEQIIATMRESLLVLTPDLRIRSANEAFYGHFQVTPEETEGQLIYRLGNHQWDIPHLHTLLEEILPNNQVFKDFEVTHNFEQIGRRTMLLNACRLDHVQFILLAIEDITERKQAEDALHQLNQTLEEQVVLRTAQVQSLAAALTLAEQEERRRIAQILHDDLQQQLYRIQVQLLTILPEADSDPRVAAHAQKVHTWLDDAIRITRQLTVELSPPILLEEGLTEALGWLAAQMTASYGLQVSIRAVHAFSLPDEDIRVLLLQLVRELLFNVVKHAATDQAMVELQFDEAGALQLTVSDAGCGFDVTQAMANKTSSFGLFSVRERLALFGGRMDIASTLGQCTSILLTVPLS